MSLSRKQGISRAVLRSARVDPGPGLLQNHRAQFDIRSLFASGSSLALVPAIVAGIVIARVAPGATAPPQARHSASTLAAGMLQATTLTFRYIG
jgi:hypothetical protein